MRHDDSGRPQPDWQARIVFAALILFGVLTIYNYYKDYCRDEKVNRIGNNVQQIDNALRVETDIKQ